jgi:hypothetical protein
METLMENLPYEIYMNIVKFSVHPVAEIFKKHININHNVNFTVLTVDKCLDDSNIKTNIILERDLNNDVGFTNIGNYNLYYGWIIYFYDSIYEQIKEDEDNNDFKYFYDMFLESRDSHIMDALIYLRRIQ